MDLYRRDFNTIVLTAPLTANLPVGITAGTAVDMATALAAGPSIDTASILFCKSKWDLFHASNYWLGQIKYGENGTLRFEGHTGYADTEKAKAALDEIFSKFHAFMQASACARKQLEQTPAYTKCFKESKSLALQALVGVKEAVEKNRNLTPGDKDSLLSEIVGYQNRAPKLSSGQVISFIYELQRDREDLRDAIAAKTTRQTKKIEALWRILEKQLIPKDSPMWNGRAGDFDSMVEGKVYIPPHEMGINNNVYFHEINPAEMMARLRAALKDDAMSYAKSFPQGMRDQYSRELPGWLDDLQMKYFPELAKLLPQIKQRAEQLEGEFASGRQRWRNTVRESADEYNRERETAKRQKIHEQDGEQAEYFDNPLENKIDWDYLDERDIPSLRQWRERVQPADSKPKSK